MKPYLPRKVSGDIDRITASTWNQLIDCIDYAMNHPRGDGLTVLNKAAGLLTAAGVAGGAPGGAPATSYSGYFTLSMTASTASGATVTIADGATGSNSIAVVNGGSTYSLPPYSEIVSTERVFLLKYTPAVYASGGVLVSSAAMAISSVSGTTLPGGGTSGAYYYQLGRTVSSAGGPLRIVQDHTDGVANFLWFVNCNYYTWS